ncbi:cytochrome P450 [Actinomadura kijaniata]|uniref:cytochrome P450 n=1 Tax=Actinomadura kijaniata TaxID=46161 RepID=UPI000830BAEB|nr:cytochrome P450 [Actinomadura kijaniata]
MTVNGLPLARPEGRPLDPPPELAEIRARAPISPMTYPDGHEGWLVTGYAQARAVLADNRFSARYELAHLPYGDFGRLPPAPAGDISAIDPPEHTRYRRLLAGAFTVRRMALLAERAEEITVGLLDAMAGQGPPADLVTALAQPLPGLMICELLGVPAAEREGFQRHAAAGILDADVTPEDAYRAWAALSEHIGALVPIKRAAPTEDLISDLTAGDLTDEEITGLGVFLLGAGLDTTGSVLARGVFALLTHPEQFALLRADPGLVEGAVEELLRYLSIGPCGLRTALEDVEVDGVLIRAGQTVTISQPAANRDPARFPDPDALDVRRDAAGHLTFTHGIHQCLGQHLARLELRVALRGLIARFPTLRLAVEPGDVPMRDEYANVYGLYRLPVAW